jgi:2',3'-cyclic-nucleotide 2'-phosphodiesterase (5'-nucleotidase family)
MIMMESPSHQFTLSARNIMHTTARFFCCVVAALVFIGVSLGQTTITILHMSDTHSHLDAFGPKDHHMNGTIGGIAKAAAVIAHARATEPNALVLHGGDFFHGDFMYNQFFGVPELQLLQGPPISLDAMTIGNHELEGGPDGLYGVLTGAFGNTPPAPFPLLSANMNIGGYPGLAGWIQPAVVKTVGGIKVGIVGLTVPDNPTIVTGGQGGSISIDSDVFTIAGQQAYDLRVNEKVDVVVCLSHLGFLYDEAIAANVAGIDVIVGAHDHALLTKPVSIPNPSGGTTLIVQAGPYYEHIGQLSLDVSPSAGGAVVAVKGYTLLPVDRSVKAIPEIQTVVNDLKQVVIAAYGDVYRRPVAFARHTIDHIVDAGSRRRDTPMGNLVTDAYRRKGKTEIAITANGFIDQELYEGPVVGNDIFHSVGYGYDAASGLGFRLVKLQMTGIDIITGLEATLFYLGVSDDMQLQVSGLTYRYDGTKPVGSRLDIASMRVHNTNLDPAGTYTVTTNEGIAQLLPMMGLTVTPIGDPLDFEYNVVRDYLKRLHVVNYASQGRIIDVSLKHGSCDYEENDPALPAEDADAEAEAGAVPTQTQLDSNYPNPFNPTTMMSFRLSVASTVKLTVYDALGREVTTLIDGVVGAGEHSISWNAGPVASGVYFYRMIATGQNGEGSFSATKRMVYMK